MIKKIFEALERELGALETNVSGTEIVRLPEKRFVKGAGEIEAMGAAVFARLVREAVGLFGDLFLGMSKTDRLVYTQENRGVFRIRCRPDASYYRTLRKPLPKPDNPEGCDAVGVELALTLFRGIVSPAFVYKPELVLSFEVWGEEELAAFKRLYHRFRPEFAELLGKCPLKLWTACVFPKVKALKSCRFTRQLPRYLEEKDDENCFHLEMMIKPSTPYRRLAAAFPVLAALYIGTLTEAAQGDRDVFEYLQAKLTGTEERPVMTFGAYH